MRDANRPAHLVALPTATVFCRFGQCVCDFVNTNPTVWDTLSSSHLFPQQWTRQLRRVQLTYSIYSGTMQYGSVAQLMQQFTYIHISIILILIVVVLSVLTLEYVLPNYVSKKSFATKHLTHTCTHTHTHTHARVHAHTHLLQMSSWLITSSRSFDSSVALLSYKEWGVCLAE